MDISPSALKSEKNTAHFKEFLVNASRLQQTDHVHPLRATRGVNGDRRAGDCHFI